MRVSMSSSAMDQMERTVEVNHVSHRAVRGGQQLVVIGRNHRALLERWPVWPETMLSPGDWQSLLQGDIGDETERVERLRQAGLLHVVDDRLVPSLPIYEQARNEAYQSQINAWARQHGTHLAPFAERLRHDWQAMAGAPAWEVVGHNLLLGFWLANCGGQLCLACSQASTAALLIGRPGAMLGVWLNSLRLTPELAVVDLVGRAYPGAEQLGQLLRLPDVMRSLASADSQGKLIIHGDMTMRMLQAVSAYRQTSPGPWQPHDYWLNWPIVDHQLLNSLRPALELASRALRLCLLDLVAWVERLPNPHQWRREDMGLLALVDLIGVLEAEWVQSGLLLPVEQPWLDSRQWGGSGALLQEQMLRGLGK